MARIIDLADILTALADNDVLAVSDIDANQDKKLTASNLKSYILSGKAIGGASASDITVNNATQTLTNKTLTSPKVNSSAATNATSEDLNKLHNITVSANEINYLSGAAYNIQTQINNKANNSLLDYRPYFYRVTTVAAGGNIVIPEPTIRSALNIASNRRISCRLMIQIQIVGHTPYFICDQMFNTDIIPLSGGILDKIRVNNLEDGVPYTILIVCYDVPQGGEV